MLTPHQVLNALEKIHDYTGNIIGVSAPGSTEIEKIKDFSEWKEIVHAFGFYNKHYAFGAKVKFHFDSGLTMEFMFGEEK